ncbi:class I SAM-dependent methyltransferase [Hansschlegelia beijingensis]|uniref:Phosphatidylethanolamine/phosphatidyl-N-methylethanolamine N-methyltransferase n=1 Tax=Hansschlegelia beijingensis TaxID=1133344 RepID=A0A7W6CY38_9HYPH|nr:rRNA adenine N-6-methyltransferase family protein [Hansschlegelia beijingensis]MBB3973225.1 phosphatidylethanolamine/phosphatidyl-N-methylethanolamine N-methyltransferase [Hansschlegelia beijingensis]
MLEIARRTPRRPGSRGKGIDFADEARFLKSWLDRPLVTGAVSPSGKALARMMARYVDPSQPGLVLEIGPGTGPVTEALIKRGVAPERLLLIEYNREFVPLLERRFPGVTVVQGDAYTVEETLAGRIDQPLTATVSSLPLLTKPVRQRAALLEQCLKMSRPGAPFVQFTYGLMPPIPREAIGATSAVGSPRVWLNLPPARVWVYSRPAGSGSPASAAPAAV